MKKIVLAAAVFFILAGTAFADNYKVLLENKSGITILTIVIPTDTEEHLLKYQKRTKKSAVKRMEKALSYAVVMLGEIIRLENEAAFRAIPGNSKIIYDLAKE